MIIGGVGIHVLFVHIRLKAQKNRPVYIYKKNLYVDPFYFYYFPLHLCQMVKITLGERADVENYIKSLQINNDYYQDMSHGKRTGEFSGVKVFEQFYSFATLNFECALAC
uniref:Uncharacterized protein n=1 Tax=Theropithecus gelada TaxID=9565 RepID=A0A8D2FGY2_THEGE